MVRRSFAIFSGMSNFKLPSLFIQHLFTLSIVFERLKAEASWKRRWLKTNKLLGLRVGGWMVTYGNNRKDHSTRTPAHFHFPCHLLFSAARRNSPRREQLMLMRLIYELKNRKKYKYSKAIKSSLSARWEVYTQPFSDHPSICLAPPLRLSITTRHDAIYIANWERAVKEINNCLLFTENLFS